MGDRRFGDQSVGNGATVSFVDVLSDVAMKRVAEIVDLGALVGVSRARDGGAVSVSVTFDGETERKWFRTDADCILQLDEWAGLVEEEARRAPPPAKRERGRRGR